MKKLPKLIKQQSPTSWIALAVSIVALIIASY